MLRRHPLPEIWLMTDERIADLGAAILRLPRGSGIVFRHHGLGPVARRALFDHVRKLARRYRHVLLLADTPLRAKAWGADGAHHRSALRSHGLRSVAVHDGAERMIAVRIEADLLFISPAFPTRSHPGARTLAAVGIGLLAGSERSRSIALGGMTARRARSLAALKLHGWAAIDAFSTP